MVAGGFVRSCIAGEKVADIDLFVSTPERAEALANEFQTIRGRPGKPYRSPNAYTVRGKPPVQIIHRWTFGTATDLLLSFDFTIARAVIWHEGKGGEFRGFCDQRFYPDLAAKRLRYCNPVREEEAGGSMLRVLKFYQRGYRIPLDSLGAVMTRMVTRLDIDQMTRKGQWTHDDITRLLTAFLVEVDPNTIPGSESAHLPSEKEVAPEPEPVAEEKK